ncbi:hypothetical protein NI17_020535 [Thermobifida halotolerans]|uniref:Uncharacterized protein n=1 Tax=Thermobifida halotolerans TaxID=483545 RepID=A0A399G057_9ACTN|nr:hypothetical protein [Thermobifida halotolerans]UOE19116.1 hypothetical protein NI17_020535 [Thermobifida halotolerans]
MSDPVEAVVDRLLAVDWTGRYDQRRSQAALMREYLRRSALWSKHLDAEGWPFFDIAAAVDPTVRADRATVDRLEAELPDWIYPTVRHTCVWALHFAELRRSGTELPDLPDPFEPLLLMYERGNGFTLDGTGFIEVDFLSFPRGSRSEHLTDEPRAPMVLAELDAMDR